LVDRLQYAGEIAVHIAVPKPEYAESGASERAIATFIPRLMGIKIVLATVDLDDESVFQTNEVHHESLARGLPAEVIAALSP
jgi:hypothetical protein